ncbi:MAG: NAD(P)H-dependent oxidoreductase subunit E [Bacteroidetes bacterium]|nr:NAD(P)H-dependent oxidoreductase subunit E [Bacteroidota bacterium]
MSENLETVVKTVCEGTGNDKNRMMDIVRELQEILGGVSDDAMDLIATQVGTHRVEVESVVSFYAFLSKNQKGKTVIRLCDDIIDRMFGFERIKQTFCDALGIELGETTPDNLITLETTPCIGMCDQAPAIMVNDEIFTELSRDGAVEIVEQLRAGLAPERLRRRLGDGNNSSPLVSAGVSNNLRKRGEVIFAPLECGRALKKAIAMSPNEVIRDVKTARLRGRGGAGFPTGMKWDFTRSANGERKYVVCNADEGEPGTFKDRVVLTERPELLIEGMAIAGYAIGAQEGLIYLRAEYAYLRPFLEDTLQKARNMNMLGVDVLGKPGFNFDIRIQMGAGAYVCGEETALISSCEGLRGDPKNRPPFPAQKGYLGYPTSVNNVETFCCVARILDQGAGWFSQIGSKGSTGTKLLSISGDIRRPGVYEVPFGISMKEVLELAGGEGAAAVQVGGPSGQLIGPDMFDRIICYDDLATGGALMVFGPHRDLLKVVEYFMDFFIEESCGYCTPCRVGNVLLKNRLDEILHGKGEPLDLTYLEELGNSVKATSRCGLGQTSPNPILSSLKNFPGLYHALVKANQPFQPTFDIQKALGEAKEIAGRPSMHFAE